MPRTIRMLALFLLSAAPLVAQTEQRTIRGERVAIYNLVGEMRAVAGSGDAVQVSITRRGADAAQLRIETGMIRDRETLRIVYPASTIIYPALRTSRLRNIDVRDDGTFGDSWRGDRGDGVEIRSSGSGLEASADLVISVPRGQRIELNLLAGRIEVANVDGNVSVDTRSVEVDVSGTKGVLNLDTGSGRVSVRNVQGEIDVDAGSGGVTLEGVKGSVLRLDTGSGGIQGSGIEVAEFSADVGSGGLRLMGMKAPNVDVETGSGGATLELLSEIERLSVESGSGGITIYAPAALSAEVDVETGSGGFQTDFEITTRRLERHHIEGRIGSGKGRMDIESGSGQVRLLKKQ